MNKKMNARKNKQATLPPPALSNVDAERALLGALIAFPTAWHEVADRVLPEHFSLDRHQRVYGAMQSIVAQGQVITRKRIVAHVGDDFGEDEVGLIPYLAALTTPDVLPQPGEQVVDIAELVLHAATRRKLLEAAKEIEAIANAATPDQTTDELIEQAARIVVEAEPERLDDAVAIGSLMNDVVESTRELRATERHAGIKSGLNAFDEVVGSMLPGQVIVIAGETSAGKTALAMQIAIMVAQSQHGCASYVTSLEMEGREIAARLLATETGVSTSKIMEAAMNVAEFDSLVQARDRSMDMRVFIDARPKQTVGMIQSRLARAKAKYGVGLGVIDHLQYVRPNETRQKEEREQIKQVADDVKAMAKRLQMPILLLSHVNRAVDFSFIKTANDIKRPVLKDLYGSSAIEKAADVVVFVHRPIWFLERVTPGARRPEWEADKLRWQGKAELVQPKRRMGKGALVRECFFSEEKTWFSDYQPDHNLTVETIDQ